LGHKVISARQIERRLRAKKSERKRRIYGRTKPGSLLKHPIPVKTNSWNVAISGSGVHSVRCLEVKKGIPA
jgi:hypothetical protein